MNASVKHFNLRSLVIILVLVALLFAGIRVAGATAQSSIPGDALYPVKTTIEQTRLSLASDAGDRAQMKMAFAEQRLSEISALINEGRYREINQAVLAFEAEINGAILELEALSSADPARSARLALEITSALTRYAQTLSTLAASAPEVVRNEVNRALTSTHTASGLDLPNGDDNSNSNENTNVNGDDNSNANDNGSDDGSVNSNANDNGSDDDSTNTNVNTNANDNGSDDSANSNTNANDNGSGDDDDSSNSNTSVDDSTSTNTNTNTIGDDNTNANSNNSIDDNGNDNSGSDDNGSDDNGGNDNNSDDNGGDDNSGKGGSGKDD